MRKLFNHSGMMCTVQESNLQSSDYELTVQMDVSQAVIFVNPPGDASWTERDSGTSRDLNGLIASGNSLAVVGDEGEILHSTDQGATWTKCTCGSKHLNAVA